MCTFLLRILLPGTDFASSSWQSLGTLLSLGKLLRNPLEPWVDEGLHLKKRLKGEKRAPLGFRRAI